MGKPALQGYAAALGDLIRLTSIDDLQAIEALDAAGISKNDLIQAGVDDFDLKEIFST